jgi:hypothetical protein
VFDQYHWPFTSLTDSAVKAGGLRAKFDAIIVPDLSMRELRDGMSAEQVPPAYAGGLGDAGLTELKRFAESGGRLVLIDGATEIATPVLGLDIGVIRTGGGRREARDAQSLYAPGSIFRILVDTLHPLGRGMADSAAVYFTNSLTLDVPAGSKAQVVARYPARAEDILLSGYLQGGAQIAGKAAVVSVPLGSGSVVLFGFRPLYRAQSVGTFKMLFNALLGDRD